MLVRYEGMDDILQRVQASMTGTAPMPERSEPDMTMAPSIPDGQYDDAVEALMVLQRASHGLRAVLTTDHVRTLTQQEQDDLLELLGSVLQELRACDGALHKVAPYD